MSQGNGGLPKPPKALLLSKADNVAVVVADCRVGETIEAGGQRVTLGANIALGHKVAIRSIAAGEKILRYGVPIGSAKCAIAPGEHVHVHNIRSDYLNNFTEDRPAGTTH
jgi:SAF domain